jgi:hypothetical protein
VLGEPLVFRHKNEANFLRMEKHNVEGAGSSVIEPPFGESLYFRVSCFIKLISILGDTSCPQGSVIQMVPSTYAVNLT